MAVPVIAAKAALTLTATKEGRKVLAYVLGTAGALIFLVVLLFLMPILLLGSLMFPDTSTEQGTQIAGELAKADAVDFTEHEHETFQEEEQRARAGVGGGAWSSQSDIDVKWDRQELMILYEVLYGTSIDKPLDFTDFCNQADRMITRQTSLSSWQVLKPKENEDDEDEYETHYLFSYTSRLKSFPELLDALELNKEQKARAMLMHRYLFNQEQDGMFGNDVLGVNLGDITYTDGSVPVVYYSQKDARWGNLAYGKTGTIARSACGPTSLAMVISSLKTIVTPDDVAAWAAQNGYYSEGGGSYHSLIPAAAEYWGIPVTGAGMDWQSVVDALASGKLVIAIMGAGHFTSSGHYIVLRGVTSDGKILVSDSVSTKRSGGSWDAKIIVNEARSGAGSGGPFWILG